MNCLAHIFCRVHVFSQLTVTVQMSPAPLSCADSCLVILLIAVVFADSEGIFSFKILCSI